MFTLRFVVKVVLALALMAFATDYVRLRKSLRDYNEVREAAFCAHNAVVNHLGGE